MAQKAGDLKYCNLYKFIKSTNKKLYEVIDELCAKSLFKIGAKFQTTFLMPNNKLISKMLSEIQEGHPEKAYDMLRGLLLKGVLATKADFKGDISNSLGFKLDEPSKLKIEHNKMFKTWEGRDNVIVYDLLDDKVPSATTKSEWKPPTMKKKGGSTDLRKKMATSLASKFKDFTRVKDSISPYTSAVESLLKYLKAHHKAEYDAACFLLNGNSMITWYILIEPIKTKTRVISDEIFNKWAPTYKSSDSSAEYLAGIEHAAKQLDVKHFNKVNEIRKSLLMNKCNKFELPKAILHEYKSFDKKNIPSHLMKLYEEDIHLKPFQDELRFFYPNACYYDIAELDSINWDKTSTLLKILDTNTSVSSKEFFFSGVVSFVKSINLLYAPLSDEKHDKLMKQIKNGGNSDPSSSGGIIYHSKERELLKRHAKKGGNEPTHDFIMMAFMELTPEDKKAMLDKLASEGN